MRRHFAILLLGWSGTVSAVAAQTGVIVGTLTDAESGAPLTGADVVVLEQGLSALSGADGRFVLARVPAGEHVLRAQRIGYRALQRTVAVPAGGTVVVDFALLSEPLNLNEIIVTGAAGRARLREVGNSVARLDIDEVTARPTTLSDFLQGSAVGVAVTGGSGEAGQGKQIRLRGNSSMTLSSQPLIYVDGIRMMEGAFPSDIFGHLSLLPTGANVTTSPLDLVSVGDIERIEIIKGPAATTLFGTGSSNGVIQIFTKRGSAGPASWTADITQGTGWVRSFGASGIDYLHVEHFLRDAWWGGGYEGGDASGACVTDDPRWKGVNDSPDGACSWPGAQWYQAYRLSVDGGSPRLSYFASAEYQDDTYALPLDRLRRHGLRLNLRATLSPRIEIRSNTAYSDTWTANTASGNHAEGLLLSSMRQEGNYLNSGDPTHIANLLVNRNDQWIDRFTAGISATFAQSLSMSHRLTLGHDFSRQDLRSVQEPGRRFPPDAAATRRVWERRLRTIEYLGTYAFSPGEDVRSTLSFGAQILDDDAWSSVRTGAGFEDDKPTIPEDARASVGFSDGGGSTNAGLLGQNVLALADRYFLTSALRLDRHTTAQGETFMRLDPRVGLTWVVSDEPFWPESVGTLRLRSAYGRSGAAPSPFVQAVSYPVGFTPENVPPGGVLEPERSSEWEFGFDGAFLGGRLGIGFTHYSQTTSNALVQVSETFQAPPFLRTELRNVGELRNRGIELQLDAAVLRVSSWEMDLGLGISVNHSKLIDLGGADPYDGLNARLMVGQPVPVSFGRRVRDPEAVNGAWTDDRYLTDAAGTASLPIGPQLPTHFLSPSVSLRMPGGVILNARGEYRGGNVRFVNPVSVDRGTVSPLCYPYYVDPGVSIALRPDAPDIWQERCTPARADDYWFDADYFKLRSVDATIPVGFAFPDAVEEATLTVTLANAFTWQRDAPWWDLEVLGNDGANGGGLDSSERVPAPTRLMFGLRVRF